MSGYWVCSVGSSPIYIIMSNDRHVRAYCTNGYMYVLVYSRRMLQARITGYVSMPKSLNNSWSCPLPPSPHPFSSHLWWTKISYYNLLARIVCRLDDELESVFWLMKGKTGMSDAAWTLVPCLLSCSWEICSIQSLIFKSPFWYFSFCWENVEYIPTAYQCI